MRHRKPDLHKTPPSNLAKASEEKGTKGRGEVHRDDLPAAKASMVESPPIVAPLLSDIAHQMPFYFSTLKSC